MVLSALTAAVSEQSSFGRRTVWVGKCCPIKLKFGGEVKNSCVYLSAKFGLVQRFKSSLQNTEGYRSCVNSALLKSCFLWLLLLLPVGNVESVL